MSPLLEQIDPAELSQVTGGLDWNQAIDAAAKGGVRGGVIGTATGPLIGAAAGAIRPVARIFRCKGGIIGAAVAGTAVGPAVGSFLGSLGGFGHNVYQQLTRPSESAARSGR